MTKQSQIRKRDRHGPFGVSREIASLPEPALSEAKGGARNDGIIADQILDCYGLLCPIPVRKTAEALEEMPSGQVLKVIATDDWFGPDLEAWLKGRPHNLLSLRNSSEEIHAFIRKTA